MGDKVIVYRSIQEQLLDQWLYEDGGILYVAGGASILLVILLVGSLVSSYRRKARRCYLPFGVKPSGTLGHNYFRR